MQLDETLKIPQVIDAYENNGKFFIKTFLLDNTINDNASGVVGQYIDKNISKFLGRPLIITDYLQHPHSFYHYPESTDHQANIKWYLDNQKQFEIGKIIKIDRRNLHQNQHADLVHYDAIIEITSANAIKNFKNGKIPRYVSPSIYRLNPNDPPYAITDFEPINITLVDSPAYGFDKANIKATCNGSLPSCTKLLTQNSAICPFSKIHNLFSFSTTNAYSSQYDLSNNSTIIMTEESQQTSSTGDVTVTKQTPTITITDNTSAQPITVQVPNIPVKVTETAPQTQEPAQTIPETKEAAAPEQNKEEQKKPSSLESSLIELVDRLKKQDDTIQALTKKVDDLSAFKDTSEKNLAEVRTNSKRDKISRIVTLESTSGNEEERTKRIESLMSLPDNQLDHFLNTYVIPMTRNIKQSSSFRPKVTDFIASPNKDKNLQQSATKGSVTAKDIREIQEMIEFASIVGNSNQGAGGTV
jgi:hypothetical protein